MRVVALVALVLLAGPAGAADLSASGTLRVDQDLVVDAGDTLTLAPGTFVVGEGRIVVHGRLLAEGTPTAPVRFAAPVVLLGAGEPGSRLASVRFLGIDGTALEVRGAAAYVLDASFEANGRGILAADGADVEVRSARFRGHRGGAILADGAARLVLDEALFRDEASAVTVAATRAGARHVVSNATFAAVGRALDVEAVAPGEVVLERSLVAGSTAGAPADDARAAAVHARGAPGGARLVSRGNVFVDLPLALALEGVEASSERDRFERCEVAVLAHGAKAEFVDTTLVATSRALVFDDEAEVVGLEGSVAAASPPPHGVAVAIVLALGAATAASVAWAVRVPPRRVQAPPPATPPVPGLRPMERAVLDAVVARPGRAQAELAAALGMSRQAVHYHVKKLVEAGLVVKVMRGRETLCYAKEHAPAPQDGREGA